TYGDEEGDDERLAGWTNEDGHAAFEQGWGLFDSESIGWCVQKDDEQAKFGTDEDAWKFVWNQAQSGDALAKKALDLLTKHNPVAYESIAFYCEGDEEHGE